MTEHTRWEVEHKPIESRGGSNTMFIIGPFHFCLYDDWRREDRGHTYEQVLEAVDMVSRAPALLAENERLRGLLQAGYDEAGFEDGIWAEVKLALEGSDE